MSLQARKPYLRLKQSLVEFFSQPVRHLKEIVLKESVFEKPYWDGEYPTMHLDIPAPDWPSGGGGGGGNAVPVLNCPGCALYADPIGYAGCADEAVEIHAAVYCTNTPQAPTEEYLLGTQRQTDLNTNGWWMTVDDVMAVYGVVAGDTKLEIYATEGVIKEITIGQWALLGPSAAVWVEPTVPKHTICGKMTDGAGSVCYACVDVTCECQCPPDVTFEIDTANSDNVTSGQVATVVVLGGCAPFNWSVSGAGWTISPSGESTSRSAQVSVNSGTCNKTTSVPLATVTVVDYCSTSLTHKIQHQGATWEWIAGWGRSGSCDNAAQCGSDGLSCAANGTAVTIYKEGCGTGSAYYTKVVATFIPSGCHAGSSDYPHDAGSGSSCGGCIVTATDVGFPGTPGACDCDGNVYYWTCGSDCS